MSRPGILAAALATLVTSLPARHASAEPSGTLLYEFAGELRVVDLATGRGAARTLSSDSNDMLGYGGGLIADVEVTKVDRRNRRYDVKLRRATPRGIEDVGALPPFGLSTTIFGGAIYPSPDGALFAFHTEERAGLGDPLTAFVYVFDRAGTLQARVSGYGWPAWLGPRQLAVAAGDTLFAIDVAQRPTARRIGDRGLGHPGEEVMMVAVSPDRSALAYRQGDSIWTIGVDGRGLTRVTRQRPLQAWPTFSPDGDSLLVMRGQCGGGIESAFAMLVAARRADQDIDRATRLRAGDRFVRACGPRYWTAASAR